MITLEQPEGAVCIQSAYDLEKGEYLFHKGIKLAWMRQVCALAEEQEAVSTDYEWWCQHRDELRHQYPSKHLAILNNEVIGVGENALEAYKSAREKAPEQRPLMVKTESMDFF